MSCGAGLYEPQQQSEIITTINPNGLPDINPATGLPLIGETNVDVGGNPYGTDLHSWEPAYDYVAPNYEVPMSSGFEPW